MEKSKKQLIENNEFIKNNKMNIIQEIENNSTFRKSFLCKLLLAIILFIISLGFMLYITFISEGKLALVGFIGIIISLIILIIINNKYKLGFKENVVKNIIKRYDSNLDYLPEQGFKKEEYKICRFYETCDDFLSEDLIVNQAMGFKYADILVKSEHEDSDGRTHTKIEYIGSLARIDIKNCKCEIFLGSMMKSLFSKEYQAIKFENDEFNKLFATYTDNELISYKILTPDVMEQFVNLKNNTYGDIDIRIINDKLYVRFSSGDGFIPSLFSKKREINSIISSIAVLEEVIKTMNIVHDIIDKKEI